MRTLTGWPNRNQLHHGRYTEVVVKGLLVFANLMILAGCANVGTEYAPPIKRQALEPRDTAVVGAFVRFADRDADGYILNDIFPSEDHTPWRWTGERPALRFRLQSVEGHTLVYDLTVPDVAFQSTGPVQIQVFVNNHKADEVRMDQAGRRVIEKPIPAGWLTTKRENIVTAEIDKLLVSPGSTEGRGFIINNAGFK